MAFSEVYANRIIQEVATYRDTDKVLQSSEIAHEDGKIFFPYSFSFY